MFYAVYLGTTPPPYLSFSEQYKLIPTCVPMRCRQVRYDHADFETYSGTQVAAES